MANYSHTKIGTFEKCRYQYRLKYIDKPDVETPPTTIEKFMGDMVHRSLEKLYRDKGFCKDDTLDEIVQFYRSEWEKEYTDDILIKKKEYTQENYRSVGEKCISDYYESHAPFDQMDIIGLETNNKMELPDGNKYSVRIDKFACIGNDYYVCDYKTDSNMKTQDSADNDRQLAMYSKWVRDNYPDAKKIHLLWHMLKFNKDVESERTDEEIDALIQKTMSTIAEIESCTEWPTNRTALCDYCEFKCICPEFVHETELEEKTPEEFADDEGVKIVDELSAVKAEMKSLKTREDDLQLRLIDFAVQKNASKVCGSKYEYSVKKDRKVDYPDKEAVAELLKRKGLYESYLSFNTNRLTAEIKNGTADKDVTELATVTESYKLSQSKRKTKEGE